MKSYAICPISEKLVDERVARVNASFTVLFILLFGLTQSIWFMVFLTIDFFFRGMELPKFSIFNFLSQIVIKSLDLKKLNINAGPKIFAARVGTFLSLLVIIAFLLDKGTVSNTLAMVLGLFCFLEAAFGYCVACKIYPFVYQYLYKV